MASHDADGPLLVFVEPTSYVIALVERLRADERAPISVIYLTRKMSQDWDNQSPDPVLDGNPIRRLFDLVRFLSRHRARVLHLAGWGHPLLMCALIVGRLLGKRVFVESDTHQNSRKGLVVRVLKKLMYPLIFRLPTCFLPAGTQQAAYLRSFGVPSRRIRVAGMTVDVAGIRHAVGQINRSETRAARGWQFDDFVVTYVGRLEPIKGIADLLAAFDRLKTAEPRTRLQIVGDGSLMARLQTDISADDRIQLRGRLSSNALWAGYAAADCIVVPSHWEPWGLVVNEAMAAGIPVVAASSLGCSADLIDHKRTALAFKTGDIDALTCAIAWIARHPQEAQCLVASAGHLMDRWSLEDESDAIRSAWANA
jgi:glycosyltransferase involved in cell wall biosynthesis